MDGKTSLLNLKTGQTAKISFISGGKEVIKRLSDLGLTPGTKVKILIKAIFGGPIEIEVRGSKLFLGRGLISKIFVD